jgi:hypothetical protein
MNTVHIHVCLAWSDYSYSIIGSPGDAMWGVSPGDPHKSRVKDRAMVPFTVPVRVGLVLG